MLKFLHFQFILENAHDGLDFVHKAKLDWVN
jgi:hypothetical protein